MDNELLTLKQIEDLAEGAQRKYLFGDLEVKTAPDKMQMSGYVSVKTADLVNDIVDPSAFEKYLHRYKNNPVYCWNHDRSEPIGYVEDVQITDKGLYLNNITLIDTPIVRDKIWPLVKGGALRQQSIGFLPVAGKVEGNFYRHTEVYLLECSLVTVACNPDATLDVVKGFEGVESLDDLIKAYNKGNIILPSEVRKDFFMYTGNNNSEGASTVKTPSSSQLTPDFSDIKVIELGAEQKALYDPEGEPETVALSKIRKNYDACCQVIHLAKSALRDSYMFQVGVLTKSGGFKYDWDHVALSMGSLLGAKGAAHFIKEEKLALLEKLFCVYESLGKSLPTYEGVSLKDITEDVLATIKYKDVTFNEDEDAIVRKNIFDVNVQNLIDTLKFYGDNRPDFVEEKLKELYSNVSFGIYAFDPDTADLSFIGELLDALAAYTAQDEAEDATEGESTDSVYMESPVGELKNFIKFVSELYKDYDENAENGSDNSTSELEPETKDLSEEEETKLAELRVLLEKRKKLF